MEAMAMFLESGCSRGISQLFSFNPHLKIELRFDLLSPFIIQKTIWNMQ